MYRIGGDEFIAVLDHATAENMEESFRKLEAALVVANKTQKPYKVPLAVSKGFATFKQDMDTAYISQHIKDHD